MPDLRGLFLRGQGGNSADLGVLQEDSIKAHSHGFGLAGDVWGNNAGVYPHYSAQAFRHSTTKTDTFGEVETRPVNMAVRYLVRARP